MTKVSEATLVAIFFASAALLLGADAAANIHGVETVRVIAADEPPEYDLEQIEEEVTGGIRRTKRNYWLRAGLVGSAAGGSAGNNCGSGGAYYAVIQLACEVASEVEGAAADAARRAQADQALYNWVAQGKSDPELAPELSANIDKLLSSNLLQLQLAAAVGEFVLENTEVVVLEDESDADPGHRIITNLLRVEAIGNYLDSQVAIRLRGEAVLASHSDGAIVDRYSYDVVTPKQFIEAWSLGGVNLVASSIDDGIEKMAEVLAEEILLVVTSPQPRGKGYLVVPTAPKYKSTLMGNHIQQPLGGAYRPTKTLQPTFAWKDFRDAYARDPLYDDVAASEIDVSYDLRIYRSRPISPAAPFGLGAAELLHEFRGISAEEFTPDVTFAPCTPYTWTVRARFVGRNKTHLTYWSGTYKEKYVEGARQRRVSDRTGDRIGRVIFSTAFIMDVRELMRDETQYFPFLATSPGQKCSREEIPAAMAR